MIVLKTTGQEIAVSALKFRQKLEAFVKYHTTQVVVAFVGLAGIWDIVPADMKASLFDQFPIIGKWKVVIALVVFLCSLYKAKMAAQTVTVSGAPKDAPPVDVVLPPQP